jgi:CheY-like chemotaxis protein
VIAFVGMSPAHEGWVLLVDDHDDSRELLSEYLAMGGFSVADCASGEAALALVAERGAPTAVVTDLSLGEMSGVELAQKLRGAATTASVPILALTGHTTYTNPDGLFATVLIKPVVLGALTAALERALKA